MKKKCFDSPFHARTIFMQYQAEQTLTGLFFFLPRYNSLLLKYLTFVIYLSVRHYDRQCIHKQLSILILLLKRNH